MLLQLTICGALMVDPPPSTNRKMGPASDMKRNLIALLNWRFNLFLLNNYLFNFGCLILLVFMSDYAELKGMTSQQGASLLSLIGICNGVGRVLNSLLNLCRCNSSYIFITACTLSGVSVCFLNLPVDCSDMCFATTAVFCGAYGLLFGVQLGNLTIITHILAGVGNLNSAFGLAMLFNGAGAITGPPVAGRYL